MTEEQQQSLCELIRQLGAQAQALRDAGLQIDKKARQDFVSQADLFVEKEIKSWLKTHCPQDGFLGEESGLESGEQGTWVLDPIDGTTNYIQGMDYWCISLAYVRQNTLELGIIYAPDRHEFFFARRGKGAFLNDQRLTLREPDPETVVIGMGRSSRAPAENYTHAIARVLNAGMEYRRFGAGALMLAHVATGQVHAYYEEHMNSWDALAGMLLIVEAGGASNNFLADDGLLNGNLVLAGCAGVQARLSALLPA
ncbi:inositol monophosphatase family protein [Klebsiella spallanzanii]|jgi:myo-inositol-1(or 4)-monophosphatase|uniref:inositol monophosphatase family protein n=1 Tax=Klebsiella spallanzanii TaxID=2587528 RepID=UPI00111A725B|nr:inositol monophosphatase [Klebsiella spallanzanii]VUS22909.1 Inositol-1-monophosphatase [Klebsiella spallanzanii]